MTWLRNNLGVYGNTGLNVLEEYETANSTNKLLLLCEENSDCPIPGLVAAWCIQNEAATADLLIVLCDIRQIQNSKPDTDQTGLPRKWQRSFELRARQALIQQKDVVGTHIFMVGWIDKKPIERPVVREGRSGKERFRFIDCTACELVDLRGETFAWAGQNEYAKNIVRSIAFRALNITPGKYNSWEAILRTLDTGSAGATWLTWLEFYATRLPQTRISRKHVLKPPRAKGRLQQPKGEP